MDSVERAGPSVEEQLADFLEIVTFVNEFRSIQRLIWYRGSDERERNGDHSFQLAFIAWFMTERHLPHLDTKAVVFMALIHDLPEVYAGDTYLFKDANGEFPAGPHSSTKELREQKATERIEREWGKRFPELIHYLHRYQRYSCEESLFVYALDKLVATTNVYLDGGRAWKKLGVSIQKLDKKKRDRISKHPHTGALYEALFELLRKNPSLFGKQ